jgi:hypothetical protein
LKQLQRTISRGNYRQDGTEMKLPPIRRDVASAAALLVLLSIVGAGAADNKIVMTKARAAYYTLNTRGFGGFECTVKPNWEIALRDTLKTNPDNAKATLKILNQLAFSVALGATGPAKVTHNSLKPANDKQASGLNKIYGGIEQTLVGFFSTWSLFVRGSPLPAPQDSYDLNERSGGWHLHYKEGTADVVIEMEKDFVIRELKVTTDNFVSSIRPQFSPTRGGLLLTAYRGDIRQTAQGGRTLVDIRVTYREVNGFQVPAQMAMSGSTNGTSVASELNFMDCKAVKN